MSHYTKYSQRPFNGRGIIGFTLLKAISFLHDSFNFTTRFNSVSHRCKGVLGVLETGDSTQEDNS